MIASIAYKLELVKACDNLNWNFLETCLQDFGFLIFEVNQNQTL